MIRKIIKILKFKYNRFRQNDCPKYTIHHNMIDSIFSYHIPKTWEEIPEIESFDKEDEDGNLLKMIKDLLIYDIKELGDFKLPTDDPHIEETIFIIRVNDDYYLCETQNEDYIKYAIKINTLKYIKNFHRTMKLNEIIKN